MLNSAPNMRRHHELDDAQPYEQEYISYRDILRFVRYYFWTIALAVFFCLAVAFAYVYYATPKYFAHTQILIDPSATEVARRGESGTRSLDTAHVEGQVAVLRSETIAFGVIGKLNLVEDSEFQQQAPEGLTKFANFVRALLGFEVPQQGEQAISDYDQLRTAMSIFQQNLSVNRAGVSYAIEIGFTSEDPAKAAKIANATAQAYIEDQIRTNAEAAEQSSEWLDARLNQLRDQLNDAARKLDQFKAERNFGAPQQRRDLSQGSNSTTLSNNISPQTGDAQGTGLTNQQTDTRLDTQPNLPPVPVTLAELESTVDSYRRIYESYQRAYTEAVQRQSFPVANARIITSATRPLNKSSPRRVLSLLLGGMIGVLLGFAVAFLRHNFDNTVRSSKQIRERIGLPSLALIPRLDLHPIGFLARLPFHFGEEEQPRNFRVVIDAPFSPFSGALKTLKNGIINADHRRQLRCVGVTSVLPNEGKSTIIGNLAALFATTAGRTLVIDADVHNLTISQHFAPRAQIGLLEVVSGAVSYQDAIVRGSGLAPDILPVAAKQAPVSYDMLASQSMQELLRTLASQYEIILVDLPPVNPIVDGVAIASLLDGVVLVTEWGSTPIEMVGEVANTLYTAQANILGVAITKADADVSTVRWRKHWGYGYYQQHKGQPGSYRP